ncbi:hypothetical protein OC846_005633 [Tilletia horrida]|uniref:Uncharacterized protein n=1 Tax=Tilletia horrida TaxID=155126 RepID=A0AAN6JPQ5_9BASI|nr:hypothetical protein OC846_005633 [Tilletia horrida]
MDDLTIAPVLIGIRAYDIVLGLEPYPKLPPMPTSSDIRLSESWKDRDAKARAYLRRTVLAALKAMIRGLSSATEMWQLLQALHDLCTPEHRSVISRKLANLFLDDGGDMVQHLNSFMGGGKREQEDQYLLHEDLPHDQTGVNE